MTTGARPIDRSRGAPDVEARAAIVEALAELLIESLVVADQLDSWCDARNVTSTSERRGDAE